MYCNFEVRVHISGVTMCVTNFLTLSQCGEFDIVKKFVTHFVTPEIWILTHAIFGVSKRSSLGSFNKVGTIFKFNRKGIIL